MFSLTRLEHANFINERKNYHKVLKIHYYKYNHIAALHE